MFVLGTEVDSTLECSLERESSLHLCQDCNHQRNWPDHHHFLEELFWAAFTRLSPCRVLAHPPAVGQLVELGRASRCPLLEFELGPEGELDTSILHPKTNRFGPEVGKEEEATHQLEVGDGATRSTCLELR